MKIKPIIFILFSILNIKVVAAVPDWYNEPILDTEIHFYGTGSGLSTNDAIITALNYIKNKLIPKNKDLRINFPNYEIEKTEKDGKYFYIMLSIAKVELLNQQIKDLEEINKKIKENMDFIKNKNDFVKLVKLNKLEELILEAKNKIKVIHIIDKFDDRDYIKFYNSIEEEKNRLRENFKIKLVILNESLTNFKEDLLKIIENKKIKTTNESNNILYIHTIERKEQINRKFFITMIFQLKLVCNDKLVNYNSYSYSSESELSFDKAEENCINEFNKDIINNHIELLYYE